MSGNGSIACNNGIPTCRDGTEGSAATNDDCSRVGQSAAIIDSGAASIRHCNCRPGIIGKNGSSQNVDADGTAAASV